MKSKINKIVLIFLAFTLTAINVKAATASLTVDKEEVEVGETFRVTVSISSAAAWNVHANATGPVSNCKINEADTTEDATDANKTFTVDCAATEVGTVTVALTGDVTSVSDMTAVRVSGEKTVNVKAKSIPIELSFEQETYICQEGASLTGKVNVTGTYTGILKDIVTVSSSDENVATIEKSEETVDCESCVPVKISCLRAGSSNLNAMLGENSGTSRITVTATSEEPISSYTITFDGNGGNTCSPNTKTIISGQSVGTLCTPTRSGFTFNGWFTASSGGRKITSDSIIENDITLYAQWVKKVSNPKTGITSSAVVLLIIVIVSIVGYFEVKKKNINLE